MANCNAFNILSFSNPDLPKPELVFPFLSLASLRNQDLASGDPQWKIFPQSESYLILFSNCQISNPLSV
jgi:hypothetical protein